MTLADDILSLVTRKPGLTEAEIVQASLWPSRLSAAGQFYLSPFSP